MRNIDIERDSDTGGQRLCGGRSGEFESYIRLKGFKLSFCMFGGCALLWGRS